MKNTEIPNTKERTQAGTPNPTAGDVAVGLVELLFFDFECLVFLSSVSAAAQNYSIDWYTIDGGGGTSTGGVYSVSGTIGQPDAGGPMTNGQYSVTGGFWALPTAVQTTRRTDAHDCSRHSWPGHDLLDAQHAGLCVAGDAGASAPTNWTNSPSGATNPIVVPATVPAKFYRLRKP